MNVENTNSLDYSKDRIQWVLENTPFAIREEEGNYILTLGHYKVIDQTVDIDSILTKVENKEWELLMNVVAVMVEDIIKERNKNGN